MAPEVQETESKNCLDKQKADFSTMQLETSFSGSSATSMKLSFMETCPSFHD